MYEISQSVLISFVHILCWLPLSYTQATCPPIQVRLGVVSGGGEGVGGYS